MPESTWLATKKPRLKFMYDAATPPSGPRMRMATVASSRWYFHVFTAGRKRKRGVTASDAGDRVAEGSGGGGGAGWAMGAAEGSGVPQRATTSGAALDASDPAARRRLRRVARRPRGPEAACAGR